jgi:hypothetical protein
MPETILYPLIGFEGKMYIGPAGKESPTDTGMILAENIKDPSFTYGFTDIEATLRRHQGTKAYAKGELDIEITFNMPDVKDPDQARAPDTAILLESLKNRKSPITIIMLDETGGEGIIGDFELFSGDKSEENDDQQAFDVTAKPSAAGRGAWWYEPPVS